MTVIDRTLVIVGASVAGVSAAEAARKDGFDGRIILVGQEKHLPYDRPPLSKQVLHGDWDLSRIALRQPTSYAGTGIEFRLGREAVGLDLDASVVVLDRDERLGFDHLLIATGVRPAQLSWGLELENVHVLRTIENCEALRSALLGGGPLAVIGAGFMGTEVAAAARRMGVQVTVIDALAQPLGRALGDWVGAQVRALHKAHDVQFRLGVGVSDFVVEGSRATGVRLTDGSIVEAATVLVAIGSRPNTEWLEGSGLATSAGVVCDDYCLATPTIAAAGDVAAWHHRGLNRLVRVEHRMNAQEQGAVAIANLLAAPAARVPFEPVPYFWSDQYDVKIQAYGLMPADSDVSLASGDISTGKFTITYRQRGVLVGALGWNSPRETRGYRALIAQGSVDVGGEKLLTRA